MLEFVFLCYYSCYCNLFVTFMIFRFCPVHDKSNSDTDDMIMSGMDRASTLVSDIL